MKQKLLKKAPYLGSSIDPNKIALTVKGILTALIPVILAVSGVYNWNLGEEVLHNAIEAIVAVINSVGLAVGSIMALVGIIRKLKK